MFRAILDNNAFDLEYTCMVCYITSIERNDLDSYLQRTHRRPTLTAKINKHCYVIILRKCNEYVVRVLGVRSGNKEEENRGSKV